MLLPVPLSAYQGVNAMTLRMSILARVLPVQQGKLATLAFCTCSAACAFRSREAQHSSLQPASLCGLREDMGTWASVHLHLLIKTPSGTGS